MEISINDTSCALNICSSANVILVVSECLGGINTSKYVSTCEFQSIFSLKVFEVLVSREYSVIQCILLS